MSTVEPSRRRWETLLWLLPFVLLALPNCGLQSGGCVPGSTDCPIIIDDCGESGCDPCAENPNDPECNTDPCEEDPNAPGCDPCEEDPSECPDPDPVEEFEKGPDATSAIFCEIPRPLDDDEDPCATQAEADNPDNISLSEAATAMVNGESSTFALDFSEAALTACGGLPKKIPFYGEYPKGLKVCIDCDAQIPAEYATPLKACIVVCRDQINFNGGPMPPEGAVDYCEANTKLAPNHKDGCYDGVCTINGSPDPSFVDPRESPEEVDWIDHIGTDDSGGTNSLERTAATTGGTTADFNAGAASAQTIANGDGWVEFEAGDATTTVHVLGLRTSSCADPVNCPDDDPHISTVGFAIDLNSDGMVYVLEPDATAADGFAVYGPFGPYTVGERYRIRATDNHDNTVSISYHRLVGGVEQPSFATNTVADPAYPLRVDTTFRDQGAQLDNVTIVRIK
jgi:hypothetical protein